MGRFQEVFVLPGGLKKHSGIRNATLHNVTVGDDTLVENVSNYIAKRARARANLAKGGVKG